MKKKTLTLIDLIGMSLAAFVSMEVISSQAMLGPSFVLSFLLIGGTYVFTHCIICAELGSTYPDQGGIYVWVKRGLGEKWAARTSWWYWLNVVGFIPSVMIPTVVVMKQLFWPEMSLSTMIVIAIIGSWVTVGFNLMPLSVSKKLNNLGTAAKVVFCLAIICAGIVVAVRGESQITFTAQNLVPKFNGALFALIPVFVYGLTGMDVIGCAAEEMHNPKKDMPKAMVTATIVAMALYIFSTTAVQVILPIERIGETTGLIDALQVVLGSSRVLVIVLGAMLAVVFLSNAFCWALAANIAAQEAAEAGEFPAVFGKSNKHGSPVGGAIILGLASTALLLLYAMVANTNEGLFWTLLAFTGIVFLLPYIMMTIAFLKLRKMDPELERPFRIPGKKFPTIVGLFHGVLLVIACLFFLIPPEGEDPVMYVTMLVGTLVVTQIIGEVMIKDSVKKKQQRTSQKSDEGIAV